MQGAPRFQKVNCNLTTCPLNNSCKRIGCSIHYDYEQGQAPGNVDYLFISDNPQLAEFKTQTAHTSIESRWMQEMIGKVHPQASYVLSYLVRGWPVEEKSIPEFLLGTPLNSVRNYQYLEQVRSMPIQRHPESHRIVGDCIVHLQQEIQQFRPRMLIVLGNAALSVLFPRETRSVTQLIDTTLTYMNVPVRFLPSPGVLLRNPSGRRNYEQNLEAVLTGQRRKKHTDAGKHTLFTKLSDAIDYIELLKNCDTDVGFDTETLNVNSRYGNKLACLQFAESDNHSGVIPFHHPQSPFSPEELQILSQHLYDLFMKPSTIRSWVTHNAKFENLIIRQALGATMQSAPVWDTWMAAFLLDENRSSRAAEFKYGIYSLKQLAYDFLNYDGYEQGILKTREEGNLFDLDLDKLAAYGASDAVLTRRLKTAFSLEAEAQNYEHQLENLMLNFFNPEMHLFTTIEWNGFPVDRQHLRGLLSSSSPILQKLREINIEAQQDHNVQMANNILLKRSGGGLTGRVRPLGESPWIFDFSKLGHPQVLFFDVMSLPSGKVGKTGMPSVDVEWQEKNAHHPMVKKFMEYVLMKKMYDSFVKQLYDYVDPSGHEINHNTDSRIRPSYLLSSVVTGRVACRNPNLQACVSGDTPVITESGPMAIKDIPFSGELYNGRTMEKYSDLFSRKSELLRVHAGRYHLDCSPDHIHWVLNSRCELVEKKTTELTTEDYLVRSAHTWCPEKQGFRKPRNPDPRLWVPYLIKELRKLKVYSFYRSHSRSDLQKLVHSIRGTNPTHPILATISFINKYDVKFRRIQKIESLGQSEVFDLSMSNTGLFWANGFITHNCPRADSPPKKAIKDIFAAPPGEVLVQLDYKANEVRWVGILAQDPGLASIFNEAKAVLEDYRQNPTPEKLKRAELLGDVHKVNATRMFGIPLEQVTKDQRQASKACLTRGTLVTTKRGYRPIEEIKVGEEVWTGDHWAPVLDLHRPKAIEYEIRTGRGWSQIVSEDHKLEVWDSETLRAEWVEVTKLVPGRHYVMLHREGNPDVETTDKNSPLRLNRKGQIEHLLSLFPPVVLDRRSVLIAGSPHHISETSVLLWGLGVTHTIRRSKDRHFLRVSNENLGRLGIWLRGDLPTPCQYWDSIPGTATVWGREPSWQEIYNHWDRFQNSVHRDVAVRIEKLFFHAPYMAKVLTVEKVSDEPREVYDLSLPPEAPYFVANAAKHWDCVFGILYDSSKWSIAEQYGKSEEEVAVWFDAFYRANPRLEPWKKMMKDFAKAKGYIEAPHGRRRRFPIFDMYRDPSGYFLERMVPREQQGLVAEALRQSSNSSVQGLASDAAMLGAALFSRIIERRGLPWKICNAVHDSCVFTCPVADLDEALQIAENAFTSDLMDYMSVKFGINFNLPLEVEFEIGTSWGSLEKWDYSQENLEEIKSGLGSSEST